MTDLDRPVFGLGQCSLDFIGVIAVYPPPDAKCEFHNLHIEGGGPVATAMVALRRWGVPVYFAGLVGDDDYGHRIVASLKEEGVDTGGVVVREGHTSQVAFIMTEPATARRTVFWQRPTGLPLQSKEIDVLKLPSSAMLYTDGLFMEAALHACRQAKRMGVPVFVDGGTLRKGMLELAHLSDCFIVSETFSRSLSDDAATTCRRLAELGCPFVGVTLGAGGCVALARGAWIHQPAYPTNVADTTGCGDVFHAGVAYGLLRGWSPERCLDLGAWAAASVAAHLGGRRGIPTGEALEERYGEL